jgi:hypothetical protein
MDEWEVIDTKTTPTFVAFLLRPPEGGRWGIAIQRPNAVTIWEGVAAFPWVMGDYAFRRFNDLHRDRDIEDLIREWGTQEAFDDFQWFLSEEQWGNHAR